MEQKNSLSINRSKNTIQYLLLALGVGLFVLGGIQAVSHISDRRQVAGQRNQPQETVHLPLGGINTGITVNPIESAAVQATPNDPNSGNNTGSAADSDEKSRLNREEERNEQNNDTEITEKTEETPRNNKKSGLEKVKDVLETISIPL